MGLKFYHKDVSQKEIHDSGKPVHPDLYSNDISLALESLGVKCIEWDEYNRNLQDYIKWININLAQGYPVICGMKINPTQHPEWSLDHFVLAVGYNDNGFYINTNHKDGQMLITYDQLTSTTFHYSFENSYRSYFGRSLTGINP